MYICLCNSITERQVRECVRSGACSVDELVYTLGMGTACGRCLECAQQILRDARVEENARP